MWWPHDYNDRQSLCKQIVVFLLRKYYSLYIENEQGQVRGNCNVSSNVIISKSSAKAGKTFLNLIKFSKNDVL